MPFFDTLGSVGGLCVVCCCVVLFLSVSHSTLLDSHQFKYHNLDTSDLVQIVALFWYNTHLWGACYFFVVAKEKNVKHIFMFKWFKSCCSGYVVDVGGSNYSCHSFCYLVEKKKIRKINVLARNVWNFNWIELVLPLKKSISSDLLCIILLRSFPFNKCNTIGRIIQFKFYFCNHHQFNFKNKFIIANLTDESFSPFVTKNLCFRPKQSIKETILFYKSGYRIKIKFNA